MHWWVVEFIPTRDGRGERILFLNKKVLYTESAANSFNETEMGSRGQVFSTRSRVRRAAAKEIRTQRVQHSPSSEWPSIMTKSMPYNTPTSKEKVSESEDTPEELKTKPGKGFPDSS